MKGDGDNIGLELDHIYCMDCIKGLKQIKDKSIDLVLTDPPYGIGAEKGIGRINQTFTGSWDKKPIKKYFDEILRVGNKVIIFGGNFFTDVIPQSNHWIVWDKINFLRNKGTNFSDVELLWTNLNGNISEKIIWKHRGGQVSGEKKYHPTMKPQGLMKQIILKYSNVDNIILDPFMGSGTTAVACKKLNRRFIGFEINPDYCRIAEKRLANIPSKRLEDFT